MRALPFILLLMTFTTILQFLTIFMNVERGNYAESFAIAALIHLFAQILATWCAAFTALRLPSEYDNFEDERKIIASIERD